MALSSGPQHVTEVPGSRHASKPTAHSHPRNKSQLLASHRKVSSCCIVPKDGKGHKVLAQNGVNSVHST